MRLLQFPQLVSDGLVVGLNNTNAFPAMIVSLSQLLILFYLTETEIVSWSHWDLGPATYQQHQNLSLFTVSNDRELPDNSGIIKDNVYTVSKWGNGTLSRPTYTSVNQHKGYWWPARPTVVGCTLVGLLLTILLTAIKTQQEWNLALKKEHEKTTYRFFLSGAPLLPITLTLTE